MGKLAPSLTAVALAVAVTACGSEAAPAPAPTPTTSTSPTLRPTPTATPTPAPPVMPDAAKAHTEAGAKAFVVYYWQVVDYASATLDTRLIEDLSGDGCASCEGGIESLKASAKHGSTLVGGAETVTGSDAVLASDSHVNIATVTYTLANTAEIERFPSGKTKTYPAAKINERMTLQWIGERWQASQIEVLK